MNLLELVVPRVPVTAGWVPDPRPSRWPWNRIWVAPWGVLERIDPVPDPLDAFPVGPSELRFRYAIEVREDHAASFNAWQEWVTRPYGAQLEDGRGRVLLPEEALGEWTGAVDVAVGIGFGADRWVDVESLGVWSPRAVVGRYQLFERSAPPLSGSGPDPAVSGG